MCNRLPRRYLQGDLFQKYIDAPCSDVCYKYSVSCLLRPLCLEDILSLQDTFHEPIHENNL